MKASDQITNAAARAVSGNSIYTSYESQWRFLLESYLGGAVYKEAGHLVKYQNETRQEYSHRLNSTPLDNHTPSVVSVYTSFLFKEKPYRDLTGLPDDSALVDFLRDCDHEGRTLEHFMRDLSVWVSVFGHAWMIVSKPDIGAVTRADELAAGVRPYLSMLTPLVVLDWNWSRSATGKYNLDYFRYIEDVNGSLVTVREYTPELIRTQTVNTAEEEIVDETVEPNGLGYVPAVICYNKRSSVRGIGVSDVADIADLQKFIYNATSEVDQSIRLNTHPSLVKTPETNAGIGAGSIIHMNENMDPGLKPYLLEFTGASIESIYQAIGEATEAIDRIANTGAVRAKETRTMSGVSREVEFQMLNSRLSEKAHAIELAEENMWKIYADFTNSQWQGHIQYPMTFNIRDHHNDLEFFQKALMSQIPSETFKRDIYTQIASLTASEQTVMDQVKQEIESAPMGTFEMPVDTAIEPHEMTDPVTGETRMVSDYQEHLELAAQGWTH